MTIRRVAAELEARPMSLYTHFAAKADLFALMMNEFMSLIVVDEPQPADWREAVSEIARHMHAAFVAHPWALNAFTQRPRLGPNAARQAKQMASAVAGLGLDQADVWTVLGTINDYVIGNALRIPTVETAPDIADALSVVDVSEFPELKVLATSVERRASRERFDSGLQIVLDGIEQRFQTGPGRRRGSSPRKGSDASSGAG